MEHLTFPSQRNSINWFTLNQGREVCAVPGKAGTINAQGTHFLLREGAKLVESAEDILEEFPVLSGREVTNEALQSMELGETEEAFFKLLSDEPRHIEEILNKTDAPVEKALSVLSMLEMKGLARQLPGKMFVRK